ncbi:MAG: T9SS type A sorting domain-containing protein [Bacteroidales bacterium]
MEKTLLRIKIISCNLFFLIMGVCFSFTQIDAQNLIYVDSASTGKADGTSWNDAFTSLQAALDVASPRDTIWVATETYKPLKDADGNSFHTDDQTETFQLEDSVFIYGGFAGTETELAERDYDQTDRRKVSIYPNPAKDRVFVRLETIGSEAIIKLFNIHGQLSRSYRVTTSGQRVTEQLDVTALNKGIYLLQVDYGEGRVTRRLILE